jgi:hypothetical protein
LSVNQLLQLLGVTPVSKKYLNHELRDWVLPYWYEQQNDPFSPAYAVGEAAFRNLSYRSWTTLRAENSRAMLLVDRYGVLYLPKHRLSIELWIHTGEQLYTPNSYHNILQKSGSEPSIETVCYYKSGSLTVKIKPDVDQRKELIACNISLNNRSEDALKHSAISFVVRPYDYDGLSNIHQMEYKENCLFVNNTRILFFEKEPTHCYFSDGAQGDVTQYFKLGEGNPKLLATDGFSGLPAELSGINLFFGNKTNHFINMGFSVRNHSVIDVSGCINRIQTGTDIDQLLAINLNYLKVFCGQWPHLVSISQILALNRFSDGSKSRNYLQECLNRVRWDGSLGSDFLGPEHLILGILDYVKITADYHLLEKNWAILKRTGYAIWHQKVKGFLGHNDFQKDLSSDRNGFYEKYFWLTAALKALEELSQLQGQVSEALVYKEQYQALWLKLKELLGNTIKNSGSRIIPVNFSGGFGAGIIRNLVAAYPLQLWDRGNRYIADSLEYILDKYSYQGGIFSPLDFQGIDLALSVRMGQVLIREGYDYTQLLDFIIAVAGDTWNWPDRIHPLTMKGVGENGHDQEVLYQLLLMIRNIFVLEEGSFLVLLPGIFNSNFWEQPQFTINRLATYFGEISCNCHNIGDLVQIDFWPQYRTKPEKVRIYLQHFFEPVYVDAESKNQDSVLEIDPSFHILRLKRVKSAGLS